MTEQPGRERSVALGLFALIVLTLNLRAAVTGLSPLLERVAASLRLTPSVAGLLGALPPFCFALGGLLAPILLRRLAAERVVLVVLGLAAAGEGLRPWAGSAAGFLVVTVVALLGSGIGNVILPVLVKGWFPHRIGPVTAIYVTGVTLGTALPALVAVPLADAVQAGTGSSETGWQVALGGWAALAVLAALVWLRPAAHPLIPPARPRGATTRLPIFRSRTAWGVMLIFGMNSLNVYALFAWLPARLVAAGVSEQAAGIALSVFTAIGLPFGLFIPALAARIRNQFWLVAVLVALFGAGEAGLLLQPPTGALLWASVVLAGIGSSGFPLALTLVGLRTRTPASAGTLSGFAQGLGYTIAGFGPLALGALHQATGGWTAGSGFLLLTLVVMLVGGWLAGRPHTVEDDLDPARTGGGNPQRIGGRVPLR